MLLAGSDRLDPPDELPVLSTVESVASVRSGGTPDGLLAMRPSRVPGSVGGPCTRDGPALLGIRSEVFHSRQSRFVERVSGCAPSEPCTALAGGSLGANRLRR